MSSFTCEKCGAAIIDSENGYTTQCDHYPIILKKQFTCLCYPQPCKKNHRKEIDDAYNKIPKCECGGVIETHQGSDGFPDDWYCMGCGKEFETNPFKQTSLQLCSCGLADAVFKKDPKCLINHDKPEWQNSQSSKCGKAPCDCHFAGNKKCCNWCQPREQEDLLTQWNHCKNRHLQYEYFDSLLRCERKKALLETIEIIQDVRNIAMTIGYDAEYAIKIIKNKINSLIK